MINKTIELISNYIRISKVKGFYKCPASTDFNHRNYKYFEKCIQDFGDKSGWDSYGFVFSNFERVAPKQLFPAQLPTKISWDTLQNYKKKIITEKFDTGKDEKIIFSFQQAKEIITSRMGSYDPERFFNEGGDVSTGISLFLKNIISPYFCVLNKAFVTKLKKLDSDIFQMIDLSELTKKRHYLKNLDKKTQEELKKIIEEQYWI